MAFLAPAFSVAIFAAVCLAVLVASMIDLRYGLALAFLELLIGGQGYLFSFDRAGLNLSIRMAIFIIVLGVGLLRIWQEKNLALRRSPFWPNYLWLGLAIVWGLLQGFGRGRDLAAVFFDANAWFFLGYLVVVYSLPKTKTNPAKPSQLAGRSGGDLINLFAAAVTWLSLKTLAVFFIFTHQL